MQTKTFLFKYLLLIHFFLWSGLNNLNAQKQSSSIALIGGYSHDGIGGSLNYNHYVSRTDFIQAGAYFSSSVIKKDNIEIPYDNFSFNVAYFFNAYSNNRETFNLNIGLGPLLGYEIVNKGSDTLDSGALILDKSKFLYGGYISGEIGIYLTQNLNLIFKANQYYHSNSDLGQFTFFGGLGFMYIIY